ncbi:Endonuclease 2 [Abeliophyllum distichum]|uniref:Aspergillus nuclease S1 n=1 Tax=Abeliophyllum distichum TaxID=126358 RepID=A0ABD1U218_9LAMI
MGRDLMSGDRMSRDQIEVFVALFVCLSSYGWGIDGHLIICRIAQPRLSKAAADAVENLLPAYADNNLGSTISAHIYSRDCKYEDGIKDRCVAGAINNYTTQLLSYGNENSASQYNLTEALLFLSHFMGDIHQPLHVGFTSDRGGNTIDVNWYKRKSVLHHVWDDNIIEIEEDRFYDSNVDEMIACTQEKHNDNMGEPSKGMGGLQHDNLPRYICIRRYQSSL